MTNTQLKHMISEWTITKSNATVANAVIAILVIIIFIFCLIIPLKEHFYQKIALLCLVLILGTFGLVSSSEIRYKDSLEVGAYQKIALNREMGTQIPHEKHLMRKDERINKIYQKKKHPTLHLRMLEKYDQKQYVKMHHLLRIRHLFNIKNNRVKHPNRTDNL